MDYTKALAVLEDYESRDGLSVHDLIDSKKHGALTYNDFLVLPGYIGKQHDPNKIPGNAKSRLQASQLLP